jgi:hypothetical protein
MWPFGRTAASDLEEVNDLLGKFAEALTAVQEDIEDLKENQSVIPDGCEVQPAGWAAGVNDQLDKLAAPAGSQARIREDQITQLLWWANSQGIITGIPATTGTFLPDIVASKAHPV